MSNTQHPISLVCPACQSAAWTNAERLFSTEFPQLRRCRDCGTFYRPPAPVWLAVVGIVLGSVSLMTGLCGVAAIPVRGRSPGPEFILCFAILFFAVGWGTIVKAVRLLRKPASPREGYAAKPLDRPGTDSGDVPMGK